MNKKKKIPALRFPEFQNSEEWEETKLEKITISENSNLVLNKLDFKNKGYAVYGADSIVGYIDSYQQEEEYISIVKDGSGVGRLNKCKEKSSVLGTLVYVKSKNTKKYLLDWIYYLLGTIDFSIYIKGSGIPHIYYSDFKNQIVYATSLREQQKIASCLSSLDDLIDNHSEKLALLEKHKKGLMQKLFPREGQKVPELRFPEFQNSGEWEEKKLGEVGEIITGNTPNTKDPKNYNGNKLFVSPADISDNRYVSQTKTTLSEQGFLLSRNIQKNSVLFVCIGSTIGKVAQNKIECATNQQINSVIPYDNYESDFIYSMLEYYAPQISSIAGNQAIPIINKSLFASVTLLIPTKKEQQKIASCLSSLDELITTQREKIEQLKQHKKGLMQGLFVN